MTRAAVAALCLGAIALAPGAAAASDEDRHERRERGREERHQRTVDAARILEIVDRMCVACHGTDGNGSTPLTPEFPRLAGTQREYLAKQMHDFRKGRRKSAIMEPIAALLSEAEAEGLATHFASQRPGPVARESWTRLELGRSIYLNATADTASCSSCHLEDGAGNVRYPRIAGQHPEYTVLQLKAFRNGDRDNDKGLVMQAVASKMPDEAMQAVAEYVASLGVK
jgi:cytochrome c553